MCILYFINKMKAKFHVSSGFVGQTRAEGLQGGKPFTSEPQPDLLEDVQSMRDQNSFGMGGSNQRL